MDKRKHLVYGKKQLTIMSLLEKRGLSLEEEILYITDGGKGIIKALRERDAIRQLRKKYKSQNIY